MMSLLRSPWTSTPAALSAVAWCADPSRPCSSESYVAKITVACTGSSAITRAASRTAEVPEPLSSAPGASFVVSALSELRES